MTAVQTMTLQQLATLLEPIAKASLLSQDREVQQASVVLAALMGCIIGEADAPALAALSRGAQQVCDRWLGLER